MFRTSTPTITNMGWTQTKRDDTQIQRKLTDLKFELDLLYCCIVLIYSLLKKSQFYFFLFFVVLPRSFSFPSCCLVSALSVYSVNFENIQKKQYERTNIKQKTDRIVLAFCSSCLNSFSFLWDSHEISIFHFQVYVKRQLVPHDPMPFLWCSLR